MAAIKSFRKLEVYQLALEQATVLYDLSKSLPREEVYGLTDQLRRCSRAVCGLLAEGRARRRYRAAFVNKVNEALGEAAETQAWLDHARAVGYLTPAQHAELDRCWQSIGAMLHRMIQRADDFCSPPGR